ncbi:MAG: tRNA uridine-5-carboxymethylaminomethyl(34) synthesis GTPase MnmE [Rhizobiaceae bacterium]
MASDTIFALASGRLPSGIAVIRVSGPHIRFVLETICGRVPEPRSMQLVRFVDSDNDTIDTGLVAFFESPASFTGEDCAELHLHGGVAVVRAMLGRLGELDGLRAAEAGEFTKRAFMAGKLDLTQAEGLADLVSAETEAQRRLAIDQSSGGLKSLYEDWRSRLLRSRAMVEAAIDFSDEDDVAERAMKSLRESLMALSDELNQHVAGYRSGEIIRDGYQVVIAGAPNAGKSSLLNALVKRDVAIASDEAGTTRDLIEVRLEIGGNLVVLTDTAGLRDTESKVEAIGVERARARLESADLVLLVSDMQGSPNVQLGPVTAPVIRVGTHLDLIDDISALIDYPLSTISGKGIGELLDELGRRASEAALVDCVIPTRERQVSLLRLATVEINGALSLSGDEFDLIAEHLRSATDYVGRLVGRVDVEDLLDVIFSQFCIGK